MTVTQVDVSGDLRNARAYVSLMGSDQEMADCWQGLKSSLGYLRREIGRRVRLRYTPELSLALDQTLDRSVRIQTLLREIGQEEESHA